MAWGRHRPLPPVPLFAEFPVHPSVTADAATVVRFRPYRQQQFQLVHPPPPRPVPAEAGVRGMVVPPVLRMPVEAQVDRAPTLPPLRIRRVGAAVVAPVIVTYRQYADVAPTIAAAVVAMRKEGLDDAGVRVHRCHHILPHSGTLSVTTPILELLGGYLLERQGGRWGRWVAISFAPTLNLASTLTPTPALSSIAAKASVDGLEPVELCRVDGLLERYPSRVEHVQPGHLLVFNLVLSEMVGERQEVVTHTEHRPLVNIPTTFFFVPFKRLVQILYYILLLYYVVLGHGAHNSTGTSSCRLF